MMNKEKPPIGVTPRKIFIEKRIIELGGAIGKYTMCGLVKGEKVLNIGKWCDELQERVKEYNELLVWEDEEEES
jgi:hypothetical protein